jgi:hypothetical protein
MAGPRPQIPTNDSMSMNPSPPPPHTDDNGPTKRRVNFKESMDDPN